MRGFPAGLLITKITSLSMNILREHMFPESDDADESESDVLDGGWGTAALNSKREQLQAEIDESSETIASLLNQLEIEMTHKRNTTVVLEALNTIESAAERERREANNGRKRRV